MSLTVAEVEHVAGLAKLELSDQDKTFFTEELNTILAYAEQLNTLDTTEVAPMTHVLPIENVMREDVVIPSPPVEASLQNAPDREMSSYRVPKIL
jgi:aspartyl-tRNA(Asn)/glutamyl-tRNA(Gln) amidotransferase subunit C